MEIKDLLDGYYNATLTDAEELELEMLMRSGDARIPEAERRLYLGLASLEAGAPQPKPLRHRSRRLATTLSSAAAAVLLVVGLGIYVFRAQEQQHITEQEILEVAMGNVSMALKQSDSSRVQVAWLFDAIDNDTITNITNDENL